MTQNAKWAYYGGLACYFTLMLSILFWFFWQGSLMTLPFVFLLQLLPLAFPFKGLLEGKPYTYAWSSFLALYYFMLGIFNAAGEQTKLYGLLITVSSIGLFISTISFARIQGKANSALLMNKLDAPVPSDNTEPLEEPNRDSQRQTLPWTSIIIGVFCLTPVSFWLSANFADGSYGAMLLFPFVFYFIAIIVGFFVSFGVKVISHGKHSFSSIEFIRWLNCFSIFIGFSVVTYYFYLKFSQP